MEGFVLTVERAITPLPACPQFFDRARETVHAGDVVLPLEVLEPIGPHGDR